MKHSLWTLSMLAVAAVTIGRPATLTAQESLFCTDLQLRAVLQLNRCWLRCNSVGTRRHAKPSDVAQADCRWTCWDRYSSGLDRIQHNSTCAPTPPPGPNKDSAPSCTPNQDMCSARLAYVQSGCMLCRSYCAVIAETDGGDGASCTKGCDEEFATQKDTILGDCVCQDGPAAQ